MKKRISKKHFSNLLRGLYIFQKYTYFKKWFLADLILLARKWDPKFNINSGLLAEDINKHKALVRIKGLDFCKNLTTQKRSNFNHEITEFLQEHDLGFEWGMPIIDYIASGYFVPPDFNLFIKSDGDLNGKQRVVLILNPDTSLDDVESAWRNIRRLQKELFPKWKKINVSKKSFGTLKIAMQDFSLRNLKDNNAIDSATYKKYKIHDLDIVGTIWEEAEDISEEADRKRKNRLRTIRKRMKK